MSVEQIEFDTIFLAVSIYFLSIIFKKKFKEDLIGILLTIQPP